MRTALILAILAFVAVIACMTPVASTEVSVEDASMWSDVQYVESLSAELENEDASEEEAFLELDNEDEALIEAESESEVDVEADAEADAEAETEVESTTEAGACAKQTKIAQIAARRARANSIGRCAAYCADAIIGAGIKYTRVASAKNGGPNLRAAGFVQVPNNAVQAGDVRVIQSIPGHPHGHMQIWTGSQWVSDFKQRDAWPGASYRSRKPAHATYRLKC